MAKRFNIRMAGVGGQGVVTGSHILSFLDVEARAVGERVALLLAAVVVDDGEAVAIGTFVNPASTSPFYWAGIEDPERDGTWTTVLGAT